MRRVKDYDEITTTEHYVVKKIVEKGLPAVIVYDNFTGTDAQYYRIYNEKVLRVTKARDYYTLYI